MKNCRNQGSVHLVLLAGIPCLVSVLFFVLIQIRQNQISISQSTFCVNSVIAKNAVRSNLLNYLLFTHNPLAKKLVRQKRKLKKLLKVITVPSLMIATKASIASLELRQRLLEFETHNKVIQQRFSWEKQRVIPKNAHIDSAHFTNQNFRLWKSKALDSISTYFTYNNRPNSQQQISFQIVSKPLFKKNTAWLTYFSNLPKTNCSSRIIKKGKKWVSIIEKLL